MELHDDTEQRIFNAAQRLFLQKGLSETTMQDIADLAGISRTSLHYYFRSKDRLFEKSLNNLIRNIMPRIDSTLAKDISLRDKIVEIATSYIEQLRGNELLPGFLIMELRRDPQEIIRFVFSEWTTIDFQSIKNQMDREVEAGLIRRFDISQMVITIMGLCTFPFICEPILSDVFKALGGHQTFDNFITERKNIVNQMLSLWLTPSEK
ncbi:MAG: TetR/AcrR family transcriptional regulator [Paludibacteraceae bacterium]|nr:TetR/AcrR family transcriptional regulator [Paludibacteraceae bacterium]